VKKPSDDEIARVEAWRAESNRRGHLAYRARMEEKAKQARAALAEKIVGHAVTAVDGEVDGEDWQTLVLALDDGATLTIRMVGWDERRLEITHDSSPTQENRHA
jgi:hypothetical protein